MIRKTKLMLFLTFIIVSSKFYSQTADCNGVLPFEEQNGLLTIEMESGIINDNRWQIATETTPETGTEQITYLHWTGSESFSALSGAPIVYKIKINNPGTYRFAWRMRVGKGTSKGEHNDAWLKIDGEDFYGIKDGAKVYPKPMCSSDPNLTCAAGSSTENFIKAFGNRLDYGFVTNTNDHVAHRVFVTFNEAKVYTITVDARSSYLFIDKMVLHRSDVSGTVAFDLNNPESKCYDALLSADSTNQLEGIKVFPNPTSGVVNVTNSSADEELILSNVHGVVVRKLKGIHYDTTIDISNLVNGVYFLSNRDFSFSKKIVKM